MYSRQGSIRLPQRSRGHDAPTSRRGVRVFGLIFVVCALAVMNFLPSGHRALSSARRLCKTYFDYGDYDVDWEDLFGATNVYDGDGDRSLLPNDPDNIGYFLTLTSCPDERYPGADPNDPGHAFYDAAATLKYSIERNTYAVMSQYTSTMYAIVDPSAIRCNAPDGGQYDRVKVLQDLGYHVTVLGSPISKTLLSGYVKEAIDYDAGDRDFLRLHALTFTNHQVVVLVDFTTLMMKPIDSVYDDFISNPDQTIGYTLDYPTKLPNTGNNTGPNMHWIMMKPDPTLFATLINLYQSTAYSPRLGWDNSGVKNFKGVLGVKGFLSHYFSKVETGKIEYLQRCVYGNDNSNPFGVDSSGASMCRDPSDCQDCRLIDFDSIKVIKMMHTCGKPWECSYDESWDLTTKPMCEGFHRSWFQARMGFEDSCWENGPPSSRSGTFHPDVFMGFCECEGETCYEHMIETKPTSPPTMAPTPAPTLAPTVAPTVAPSPAPSLAPTLAPTPAPVAIAISLEVCQNFAIHAGGALTLAGNDIQHGDVGSGGVVTWAGAVIADGEYIADTAAFAAETLLRHAAAMAPRDGAIALAALEMGGETFTPGTYKAGGGLLVTSGSVTLDGQGDVNSVFLFQAISFTAAAGTVIELVNGARAENVLWAMSSAFTVAADSILEGSVLAGTITLAAGCQMRGCAISTGAITFAIGGWINPTFE